MFLVKTSPMRFITSSITIQQQWLTLDHWSCPLNNSPKDSGGFKNNSSEKSGCYWRCNEWESFSKTLEHTSWVIWIFESFFNDIVELLVKHTNRYANRDKNNLQFTVTNDEMMKFIGIIFLSGYNKRTCETDYWSKSPDLECLIVASAMSRTRFQHIKSYLHAADNQNLSETKMAKIEPLYQILNEKFQRYGIFYENLSIDESMVPYFGPHSCK